MSGRTLVLLSLVLSVSAQAQTRRLAIVVGSNAGASSRPPLRYAETDAGRMARVLVELGEVTAEDVWLIQGGGTAAVEHAFSLARARVEKTRGELARSVLYFYFSGHSDGEAMELGQERLSYAALRDRLAATRADVRVAIVDACKSGGGLAEKGGRPAEGYRLKLVDELTARGEVFMASSAPDEASLESQQAGGGFFTAHLVSGLRGAADLSGDGRVTLAEAYRYVYDRTVSSTAAGLGQTQHPTYDYRLSGQGELVLSVVSSGASRLAFSAGVEQAWVRDLTRDQLVAEVQRAGGREVAVAPGAYAVVIARGGETRGLRVELAQGERRTVEWEQAQALKKVPVAQRGAPPAPPGQALPPEAPGAERLPWHWSLGGGVVAGSRPPGYTLRLGVRTGLEGGVTFALLGNLGGAGDYVWKGLSLRVGHEWRWRLGMVEPYVAIEGGPVVFFNEVFGSFSLEPSFALVPRVGAQAVLPGGLRVGLGFDVAVTAAPLNALLSSTLEFSYPL